MYFQSIADTALLFRIASQFAPSQRFLSIQSSQMSSLFRRLWSHLAYLLNLSAPRFFSQIVHALPSVQYAVKPFALQALQINFVPKRRWFLSISLGHSLLSNIFWHALQPCELSFSVPTHLSSMLHFLQKLSAILSSVRLFFFWTSGRVTSFWHSRHLVQLPCMTYFSWNAVLDVIPKSAELFM